MKRYAARLLSAAGQDRFRQIRERPERRSSVFPALDVQSVAQSIAVTAADAQLAPAGVLELHDEVAVEPALGPLRASRQLACRSP